MEYSIWLTLPESTKKRLDEVVTQLAAEHGGPFFEPHLTLLSGIKGSEGEVIAKSEQLAMQLNELPLTLAGVSFSVTYFQCVLVRITPTAALLDAYLAAATLFSIEPALFMPHISVFYGNHSMPEREKLAQTVNVEKEAFVINTLTLTPSVPNPAEWNHIVDFPLQPKSLSQ